LYDSGALRSAKATVPVASVGNVSVGGTGKTPFVAFLAQRLQAAGAVPAIVMRGVGDDESQTYELLVPGVAVIVEPNRVSGAAAAVQGGADVVLLDDGFQHRRIKRDVDIVLLSADRADASAALLPAGPQREPLASLARASLAVIVRKAADRAVVAHMAAQLQLTHPTVPQAAVALLPDRLSGWLSSSERSLDDIKTSRLLVVSAIGDPDAFLQQLKPLARGVESMVFRDHHRFTARDVDAILGRAGGFDMVVCTLKDAVKLGPLWPRQGPELWYVCQRLEVDWGGSEIDRMMARLLDLRPVNRE
jgi:tetraacyldisaccharide 4'-kinase